MVPMMRVAARRIAHQRRPPAACVTAATVTIQRQPRTVARQEWVPWREEWAISRTRLQQSGSWTSAEAGLAERACLPQNRCYTNRR